MYVCERLNFDHNGKGYLGKATAANRTREIRPSGMRGGLAETWAMVMAIYGGEAETPKIHAKPKVARTVFLPDNRCLYPEIPSRIPIRPAYQPYHRVFAILFLII